MSSLHTVRPALQPDRKLACVHSLPHLANPVNLSTEPLTLAEIVDHEALAYREWHTPQGDFLARQMERLAQLIRFTGANDGEEHEARMDVMENDVREEAFNRGYYEGKQAARSELGMTTENLF